MKRIICLFKRFFVCLLLLFTGIASIFAQRSNKSFDNSALDSIDIFLLTCTPHNEIYSLYGHTSIRIIDHRTGDDIAVNFGVFDSTSDNFVLRFVFGLTDYMMATCDFTRFLDEYRYYGSGVYQQHINFSRQEKAEFLSALYENARPENVVYRYNFLYNNCTTKARDIILNALDGKVDYKPTLLQRGDLSFRQMTHLKNADHPWAAFGNDLLLGVNADRPLNHDLRQFLPEVLKNDFDSATVIMPDGSKKTLVDSSTWVLTSGTPYQVADSMEFPLSPKTMAILFSCAILSLCIAQLRLLKKRLLWVNYCIILIYSLFGFILGAMLFSKHPTVSFNLQILILNPLFMFIAFPKLHFKWRWHVMLSFIFLFYLGNIFQSYAEGMNIVALSLLMIVLTNLAFEHYGHLAGEK